MNSKNYILQELVEICPFVAKINKTNVYSVSLSYFDNLPGDILRKTNSIKDRAYNFPSATPFSIPENYFKNLPATILQKVNTDQNRANEVFEETESIAPLLNTVSKKPLYSIPPGFFDKVQIPVGKGEKKQSKVVPISSWSKYLKFSAAAVVTSFLAIGLYTITGKDFIISRRNSSKSEIKNLSKEEIVNFLRNSANENVTSASPNTKNANAIKSSLKQVSDKEIQQFLKETGESDEI